MQVAVIVRGPTCTTYRRLDFDQIVAKCCSVVSVG